jgi:hypothetical protein
LRRRPRCRFPTTPAGNPSRSSHIYHLDLKVEPLARQGVVAVDHDVVVVHLADRQLDGTAGCIAHDHHAGRELDAFGDGVGGDRDDRARIGLAVGFGRLYHYRVPLPGLGALETYFQSGDDVAVAMQIDEGFL